GGVVARQLAVADYQVKVAVAVDIARGKRLHAVAHGIRGSLDETAAGLLPEQQRDAATDGAAVWVVGGSGHGDVEQPVMIEVAAHHRADVDESRSARNTIAERVVG